jgi:hypothetical protein
MSLVEDSAEWSSGSLGGSMALSSEMSLVEESGLLGERRLNAPGRGFRWADS